MAQSTGTTAVDAGGSFAVVLGGLAVVIALLIGSLWLLKRLGAGGGMGGFLRVIGGCAVGPRERVVAVEAGETVLLVGVGPGSVSLLHTLPRSSVPEASGASAIPGNAFAGILSRLKDSQSSHGDR